LIADRALEDTSGFMVRVRTRWSTPQRRGVADIARRRRQLGSAHFFYATGQCFTIDFGVSAASPQPRTISDD
jgi:hypothetical protein